jgi:hypothetical protein
MLNFRLVILLSLGVIYIENAQKATVLLITHPEIVSSYIFTALNG